MSVVTENNIKANTENLDVKLNQILSDFIVEYNYQNIKGFNIANKYPTVKFVAGMIMKTIITPYTEDEFLFAGFKFISDFF
jgi:hypothetical protein